jgi:peptidoglycan/LPS O-acetylase OafA/YrhL
VWLGTVSYTVYLFHMQLSWPVTAAISKIPGFALPFSLRLLVLLVSIPILGLIYRFVEAPFLRAPRSDESFFRLYTAIQSRLGIKREEVQTAQV